MTITRARSFRLPALGLASLSVILVVTAMLLLLTNGVPVAPPDIPWVIAQVSVAVGYSVLGAVIAWHQPRNRIGWLLVAIAVPTATVTFAEEYAIRGLISGHGSLPGALWMAWLEGPVAYLVFPLGLSLLVLIFPTGRPPARAWWIVLGIGFVATLMSVAAVALDPHNLVGALVGSRGKPSGTLSRSPLG
jgi:hypothetical protein